MERKHLKFSIEEIADVVGVSKRTLFRYLSKERLRIKKMSFAQLYDFTNKYRKD
jgi:transcriptional regulator with XRE-family HTH domain